MSAEHEFDLIIFLEWIDLQELCDHCVEYFIRVSLNLSL